MKRSDFGHPNGQHERFTVRKRSKSESFVEALRPLVDSLHDDRPRADEVCRRQRPPYCIGKQARAQTQPLVACIHRELPQHYDWNRFRHVPAYTGRETPPFHRACGEAVEPDHARAIADHVGPRAALGLVEVGLAP